MIDYTPELRAVRDQGPHRGTCLAFAVTAVHEHARVLRRGSLADDLSVELLFWRCKQLDSIPGDGTSFDAARDALEDPGQCDETLWPYDPQRHIGAGYKPPAAAVQGDTLKRAKMTSTGIDVSSIACALRAGAIVAGLQLWEGFYDCDSATINPPAGDVDASALHAVCLVGIDDDDNAVKIRNSWGARWGQGGYAWIDLTALHDVLLEAWIVEDTLDPD